MPTAASKLLGLLAVEEGARQFTSLGEGGRLTAGATLPTPQPVFPRYVEEEPA
jgi:methionyl-tRNA synthetase